MGIQNNKAWLYNGLSQNGNFDGPGIKGGNEGEISTGTIISPKLTHNYITFKATPITRDNINDTVSFRADLMYLIRLPSGHIYKNKKKFRLIQSFTRHMVQIDDYDELVQISEKEPGVKFILDYTTFRPEFFEYADKHPNMRFYFSVDYVKYVQDVEKHARELGLDYNGAAFSVQRKIDVGEEIAMLKQRIEDNRKKLEENGALAEYERLHNN